MGEEKKQRMGRLGDKETDKRRRLGLQTLRPAATARRASRLDGGAEPQLTQTHNAGAESALLLLSQNSQQQSRASHIVTSNIDHSRTGIQYHPQQQPLNRLGAARRGKELGVIAKHHKDTEMVDQSSGDNKRRRCLIEELFTMEMLPSEEFGADSSKTGSEKLDTLLHELHDDFDQGDLPSQY